MLVTETHTLFCFLALVRVHKDIFLNKVSWMLFWIQTRNNFSDYKHLWSLEFSFYSPPSPDLYQLAKATMWFISYSPSWLYSWIWCFVIIITLWKLGFSVFPPPSVYAVTYPKLKEHLHLISTLHPPPPLPSFTKISSILLCLYKKVTVCLLAATWATVVAAFRFGLIWLNKFVRVWLLCAAALRKLRSWKPLKTLNTVGVYVCSWFTICARSSFWVSTYL